MKCPHCDDRKKQVKNVKVLSGSHLCKNKSYNRKYTPIPKQHEYSKARRKQAIRLVLDGHIQQQAVSVMLAVVAKQ